VPRIYRQRAIGLGLSDAGAGVEKPGGRVGDNQEGSEMNCTHMEKAHAKEKPPGRGAEMIIYIYKLQDTERECI
jgi:hypothetical protein